MRKFRFILSLSAALMAAPATAADLETAPADAIDCTFFESRAFADRRETTHGASFNMRLENSCLRARIALSAENTPPKLRAAAQFMVDALNGIRQKTVGLAVARFGVQSEPTENSGAFLLVGRMQYEDIVTASDYDLAREAWFNTVRDIGLRPDITPARLRTVLADADSAVETDVKPGFKPE